jgi:hypothetical protein
MRSHFDSSLERIFCTIAMMLNTKLFALFAVPALLVSGADYPSTEISNGQLRAKLYLPDAQNGFYRSTRFDWSGVIYSLEYKGHNYYGPWFQKIDPNVYDFGYDGEDVVSAPFTAMVGPGEEYNTNMRALGYDEAKPGGTFIKIGVGVLRKPDEPKYDHSKPYEIVDGGKWSVKPGKDSIQFIQEISDPNSHYGYRYEKTIRLTKGKPEMVIEHTLKNTGTKNIETSMYNHNFWTLDKQPPGPDLSISFPFQIQSPRPPNSELGAIRGSQIVYAKTLEGKDRMTAAIRGFGESASDYNIRVENTKAGAGVHITGDRPLSNAQLWSIKTVMAIEPYISMKIEPGNEFNWKITYDYYTLNEPSK